MSNSELWVNIPTEPNTAELLRRLDDVAQVYCDARRGFPWYEDALTEEAALEYVGTHAEKQGFNGFLAQALDGSIAGVVYYDSPTIAQIEEERGPALADFIRATFTSNADEPLIWGREFFVHPNFQRSGIGFRLHESYLTF